MIHALARANSNGDQADVDQQQVPTYSGMQAYLSHVVERSKSYYQPTYPDPPSKSERYHGQKRRSYKEDNHSIFVYGWRLTNMCTYC